MKRAIAVVLLGTLLLGLAGCGKQGAQPSAPATATTAGPTEPSIPQNTMTGEELMQEMKIGWNLGNTFDAPDGETSWGMPMTTKEMIQAIKDMGFNTIRIPISWHKHVSEAPEYTIDESWLKRIQTVVDYAMELDMYVIINSHHDNEIYTPIPDNQERAVTYLTAIWAQIATHFRDYDYRLIFEGMNEPRVVGVSYEWNVNPQNKDCMASVEVVNVLNQAVVDTIRATGGRNSQRWLIVTPYVANSAAASLSAFRMPEDPAGKLILSIHAYTPYNLCLNTNSKVDTFTPGDQGEIKNLIRGLNRNFVSKGIPVIIGEMGCLNKGNDEARYEWAKYYISTARENGIVCCWWDNGVTTVASGTEGFGILNRRKCQVWEESQRVLDGLMEGAATGE